MNKIDDCHKRWDFFQKHQWVSPGFSLSPIYTSWQRCIKQMSGYQWSKPHVASGYTLNSLLLRSDRMLNCATTKIEDAFDMLKDEKLQFFLTDDNGCVIYSIGNKIFETETKKLGFKLGCFLNEGNIGTNAVGLCLENNCPIEVISAEHFKKALHDFVTVAAPIIDSFGKLRGTLLMLRKVEDYHKEYLLVTSLCAREISQQIHIQTEQDNTNDLQLIHNALLEHMDDGLLSWNDNNLIIQANHKVGTILKIDINKLINKDIFQFIRFAPNISHSINNHQAINRKQTTIEIDGEFIELFITYKNLSNGLHLLFIHPIDKIRELAQIQAGISAKYTFASLPFVSSKMKQLMMVGRRAIRSQAPILITGEEGVGKTELAMAIHNESEFRTGPFISLNCRTANPEQLIKEALGYDKDHGQLSKFELANSGTLYLNKIEYLCPELQTVILKYLKTGLVSRSDSQRLIPVKFQLITSTATNILDYVNKGAFGRQLYYEISRNELEMSPLRTRKDDIEYMIKLLIQNYQNRYGVKISIHNTVLQALLNFDWPGNNAQLRNMIEKILLNRKTNFIIMEDLPDEITAYQLKNIHNQISVLTIEEVEKQAITQAWKAYDGCMSSMAKALNIGRTTLWRKINKYGLNFSSNLH